MTLLEVWGIKELRKSNKSGDWEGKDAEIITRNGEVKSR